MCATLDGHQCFPFYVYDEDGSNRCENITDRAHRSFREHYKAPRISKWDLFHYTYALLHHAGYRGRFAGNLKRELPRLPLAPEFQAFVKAGERLMRLHLDYDHTEVVEPYKLREEWASGKPKSYRVQKMVLSKNREALIVNDSLTLRGIPADAFEYRLGNRTALDWVVDQYQVHLDKPTGTTSDPNMWGEEAEDEEYIVRLVKQVVAVSVATNEIVRSLPSELGDGLAS